MRMTILCQAKSDIIKMMQIIDGIILLNQNNVCSLVVGIMSRSHSYFTDWDYLYLDIL